MSFQLSCADFSFPMLPHEQQLDLIAMLGFTGVDLGLFEGRSRLWPSREYRDASRSGREMARRLSDRNLVPADVYLQAHADFTPFAANHPDPARRRKARQWFERTLEYAAACGARHISALPGATFANVPRAESFRRCRDEMAWRVERAKCFEIAFGIEAHVGSIVSRPSAVLSLLKQVPGLTLTLDYTHFVFAGYSQADVEPLLPFATHLHVRGARRGRLQCSFHTSTIEYANVLKRLAGIGYEGFLCIEYVWVDWQHCNESDNLSETILFRDFVREQLQTLKRFHPRAKRPPHRVAPASSESAAR
jgi:sugar phosphate isomerase/epimerase